MNMYWVRIDDGNYDFSIYGAKDKATLCKVIEKTISEMKDRYIGFDWRDDSDTYDCDVTTLGEWVQCMVDNELHCYYDDIQWGKLEFIE